MAFDPGQERQARARIDELAILRHAQHDIYAFCQRLGEAGLTINRPPRDGRMAFVSSPDNISIAILQKGAALPQREPWSSMANTGRGDVRPRTCRSPRRGICVWDCRPRQQLARQ